MIEEWRPVVGYEGLYEVSNTGKVRSLDRYYYRLHKGKVLSPTKDANGYLKVDLSCNGKHKTIKIHRLVAQAFLPNPDNLPEVNHKDEDKTNNSVDNLEFCDHKYNNNYGTKIERQKKTNIQNGFWTGLSKEEYMTKYYHKNKDRICDNIRIYYQKNRDRICEQKKEYYRKKKEQIQNNVKSLNDQV